MDNNSNVKRKGGVISVTLGEAARIAQGNPVRQSLMRPNPPASKTAGQEFNSGDRIVNIDVSMIEFYDRNPRTIHNNEQRDELKESIRSVGVKTPIKITQRPGSTNYIVAAGGNTRLGIVKELYQETQDVKFKAIPAVIVNYVDELHLLVEHIIENEQRYEMSFYDKATAIDALIGELDIRALPQRQQCDELAKLGVVVSLGLINQFHFAKSKLNELGQNLSGSKVIALRSAYNALKQNVDDESTLNEQFKSVLSEIKSEHSDKNAEEWVKFVAKSFGDAGNAVLKRSAPESTAPPSPPPPQNISNIGDDDTVGANPTTFVGNTHEVVSEASPLSSYYDQSNGGQNIGDTQRPQTQPNLPPNTFQAPNAPSFVSAVSVDHSGHRNLHEVVLSLLTRIFIPECFIEVPEAKYQFMIDYPEVTQNQINSLGEDGMSWFDELHEDARNVFWFLIELTEQRDTMSDEHFKVPHDCRFNIINADAEKERDFIYLVLGEPIGMGIQTTLMNSRDEALMQDLNDLFAIIRGINNEQN